MGRKKCDTLPNYILTNNNQYPFTPTPPPRHHDHSSSQPNSSRGDHKRNISSLMKEISLVQGQNELQDSLATRPETTQSVCKVSCTAETSDILPAVVPPKTYYSIRRKYISRQPTYAIDIPLRNGGGTPMEYTSAIVAANKSKALCPYTFSRHCGGCNEKDVPNEPFQVGSSKNKFISKTSYSTAFAHLMEEYEREKKDHINCKKSNKSQNSPPYKILYKEMSPNEDRIYRMARERLPMGDIYSEENAMDSVLAGKTHPYHSVLANGRVKAEEREHRLTLLRRRVMDQLRELEPTEDIIHKTDPHRDYEYAHGVKVSLPLDSDSREQKHGMGIRTFEYLDNDYSPVISGQYQTSKTGKEGKVSRRKFMQSNDKLTIRLEKKQNFQEDMSIFALRNKCLREGLSSVETKISRKYSPRRYAQ
eukprot:Tbor_TRINITY_DN5367_c3_g2::TRINITY_DN5367_c3_g2_i1::g.3805::m.3805